MINVPNLAESPLLMAGRVRSLAFSILEHRSSGTLTDELLDRKIGQLTQAANELEEKLPNHINLGGVQ